MEYLALLIPFFVCVFLFFFFRKQTVWWEYLLLLIPTFAIFFGVRGGMVSYTESDTEYLGYYSTGVTYYEKWDEYIHRTCYHSVTVGKVTTQVPYDCSYVDYHDAYWTMTLNNDEEINISQDEYNQLIYKWNTQRKFIEMNRDYHNNDGDAYYNAWNEVGLDAKYITFDHSYTNKIKASHSIFNFVDIKDGDVKKYKLYEYPEVDNYNQNTIIAKHKIDGDVVKRWNFMNAYNGKSHEFRSYLIYFYNQDQDVVNKQMSYWKGVNMNEMNIFIGVDSTTLKKQWVSIQSWSDRPEIEVELRDYINSSDSITIDNINDFITPRLTSKWHRKDFKDFNYIDINLTQTQITWLIILLLLYNIGMSVFVIKNQFTNEDSDSNPNSFNFYKGSPRYR